MEDDENVSQQNTQLQFGINNFSALEGYDGEEEGMMMDQIDLMQDN